MKMSTIVSVTNDMPRAERDLEMVTGDQLLQASGSQNSKLALFSKGVAGAIKCIIREGETPAMPVPPSDLLENIEHSLSPDAVYVMTKFCEALSVMLERDITIQDIYPLRLLLERIEAEGMGFAVREGISADIFLGGITPELLRNIFSNITDKQGERIIALAKAIAIVHDLGKAVISGPKGVWTVLFRFLYAQIHALMGAEFLRMVSSRLDSSLSSMQAVMNEIASGVEAHHEPADLVREDKAIVVNLVRAADVTGAIATSIKWMLQNTLSDTSLGRGYVSSKIGEELERLPPAVKNILQSLVSSDSLVENIVGTFCVAFATELAAVHGREAGGVLAPYEAALVAQQLFSNLSTFVALQGQVYILRREEMREESKERELLERG
jgi:HAMP domain-containing protein